MQQMCQELTTEPFLSLTMHHAPCPWEVITLLGVIPDTNVQDHPPRRETRAQIQATFLHSMFRMSLNKDASGHRVPAVV